jgi:hypothetical protein
MDDQVHRISQTSTLKLGSIQPGETLKKVMSLVPTRLIGLRVLDLNLVIKATVDHRKMEENSEEKEDKGGGDDDDDDGEDDLKLESLKVFRINREAYVDVADPIQIHSKIQSFPQPHHPTHLSYFKPFKPLHRLNLNILISNFSLQTHPSFVSMLNSVKIQSVSLSLEVSHIYHYCVLFLLSNSAWSGSIVTKPFLFCPARMHLLPREPYLALYQIIALRI